MVKLVKEIRKQQNWLKQKIFIFFFNRYFCYRNKPLLPCIEHKIGWYYLWFKIFVKKGADPIGLHWSYSLDVKGNIVRMGPKIRRIFIAFYDSSCITL